MGEPNEIVNRAGAQLLIAELALKEARRLVAEVDAEQNRDLLDDMLGLRAADICTLAEKMRRTVEGEPLVKSSEREST